MEVTKSTAHITLLDECGFAKTVLMPGDPKRSEYIAKNFLTNAVLVNDVRGVKGYTGYYKGKKVSCMASGMGLSSISIYSHELFKFFGVENIIRVGTIGTYDHSLNLFDIVAAHSASTDGDYPKQLGVNGNLSAVCSFELLKKCSECAVSMGENLKISHFLSSNVFYTDNNAQKEFMRFGICGVEMESYALYVNAMLFNKKALAICSVSDIIDKEIRISSKDREIGLNKSITLALETAI